VRRVIIRPTGQHVPGHAEVVERHHHGRLVEDAQDDALAEEHRDDADAEVVLVDGLPVCAAVLEGDAPVLGLAFLGDVEVRHDLEPADDRRRPNRLIVAGTLARWSTPSMR
jgi:hypothetical protein